MQTSDPKISAPSALRNRQPILEVLDPQVRRPAHILEIASGSGEHACYFAAALGAQVTWWPSDPDPQARASVAAWGADLPNLRLPPLDLDMLRDAAPPAELPEFDMIVCINMIHIAPWAACEGLMRLAGRVLKPGGQLFTYGPYRIEGRHTAPSNEAFDASLKARNPNWGVRDLESVEAEARKHGLALRQTFAMPANNYSLFFAKG